MYTGMAVVPLFVCQRHRTTLHAARRSPMGFYTKKDSFGCGIDLHGRSKDNGGIWTQMSADADSRLGQAGIRAKDHGSP